MLDLIIIGMGIGGITAGIYAKRAGLNILMFEKDTPGGILKNLTKIKNYPGYKEITGPDLALELLKQVEDLEIPYRKEEVLSLTIKDDDTKIIKTNFGEYEAKNVIIATGRTPKYLGLDNEKDYLGKGVSTCASCDGALYKGKNVAVVGSGNSALSESLYLSRIVNTVYLLHRGVEFKGEDELVNKIKQVPNIKIIDGVEVKKINEENGKIISVTLSNDETISVEGVFIYVGYRPDTDIFKDLNILNINGDILTNDVCETEIDGVYAVGDCIKKGVYQLVTAAAEGAIAVSDIDKK